MTLFLAGRSGSLIWSGNRDRLCVLSCVICVSLCKRGRWFTPGELSTYLYVLLCLLSTSRNWRSDSVWCSLGSKLLICSHFCQAAVSVGKQMHREKKVLECIVYRYKSWVISGLKQAFICVVIGIYPVHLLCLFLCLVLYSTSVFEYVCWSEEGGGWQPTLLVSQLNHLHLAQHVIWEGARERDADGKKAARLMTEGTEWTVTERGRWWNMCSQNLMGVAGEKDWCGNRCNVYWVTDYTRKRHKLIGKN